MNLIEMVKAAGVVGAGGAGFPTHVKLNTNVEYFIVNAAECEPLIETDKYLCRTFADRIIRTIPQIAEAIGASKKVIALKGAYEKEDMLNKLDVFLMANRITEEQYQELVGMMG